MRIPILSKPNYIPNERKALIVEYPVQYGVEWFTNYG